MSPDTISPYPDRPIRPLPKRRLRERLSPDVAESIKYPPAPKTTTPLFYHPYNLREDVGTNSLVESQHPSERERADEIERNYISRRNGDELESDEDETAYRSRIYSRHSVHTTGRSYRYVQKPDSKHPNPQPPASTASSADGYDSFENTNNKKKRKIPTPGDSNLNGVHLSSDVAHISGPDDLAEDIGNGTGPYHGSGSVGQGISGPGRGRYGRIRNGRSPLRTLSDASSNWGNGRTAKQRQSQWPPTSKPVDNRNEPLELFTDRSAKLNLQESFQDRLLMLMPKRAQLPLPKDKRTLAFCSNKPPKNQVLPPRNSPLPVTLKSLARSLGPDLAQQQRCIKAQWSAL